MEINEMNKKQWLSASNKEKAVYLLGGEVKISKRAGIKADSKVGDTDCCVTVYAAFVGIIQISNYQDNSRLAMQEAIDSLNNWEKELSK